MKTVYFSNRKDWREWLEKNRDKKKEVWLVRYRLASGKPCIPYNDAVEEALCFGWIDSIQRRNDEESSVQRFSPRKPKSNWSESNRIRARRLIREKLMASAGRKVLPPDFS